MNKALLAYLDNHKDISAVFTDYYDSIVHRTVHPNNIIRLWAKLMIREIGIDVSIDDLYGIRKECEAYLSNKLKKDKNKIAYETLKSEISNRLVASNLMLQSKEHLFKAYFSLAEIRAEKNVQYLNTGVINTLKAIKAKGIKVYLVSDFYAPSEVLKALLKHHGILNVFDDVFSSSSLKLSKHNGDIYPYLAKRLALDSQKILMIGDNEKSDIANAKTNGLHAFLLPHKKYLKQNRRNNFGSDAKDYRKLIDQYRKRCKGKNAEPMSEYILVFQVFIERLYLICKKNEIENIFFLSREGKFLKTLFDHYQDYYLLDETTRTKTHYLRVSRQASFQISFNPIEEEEFAYLKDQFPNLSLNHFLRFVNFNENTIDQIKSIFDLDFDAVIPNFFQSEIFSKLSNNTFFIEKYDENRFNQKNAFQTYINSFNIDYKTEGVHLVDIGWGGTMQESIYKFFNGEYKVTGYYLGFKKIYNVLPDTKRFGLVYSNYPMKKHMDYILDANAQIYEQLLTADHGSTLCYDLSSETCTKEFFEPIEKALYDNHIQKYQSFILDVYKDFIKDAEKICYNDYIVNKNVIRTGMKIGLYQNEKELQFTNTLNKSLYNNIALNKIGIKYKVSDVGNVRQFIKTFITNPEKTFRYFTKLKLVLYNKNRFLAFLFPMFLIYHYINLNKYVKLKILKKHFYFKYSKIE